MKATNMLASVFVALALVLGSGGVSGAAPMGTAFTYQGRLMDGEGPANGIYDLVFALCETPEGPSVLDARVIEDVEIFDGFFTVELDFGPDVFDGSERWLEIETRPGESIDPDAWVVLHPRQLIRPVPYAIYALKGSGSGSGSGDNDWMVSGNDMYAIPSGNVGIGTTSPAAPLDVRRSAPGTNVVAGLFTNPSDAADSAVSLDLAVGTAAPTAWRIIASSHSMVFTNATVAYPAMGISSSNHVGMSNGLTVSSSSEPAIYSAAGTVPLILITGKNGLVSFGEDYGVYAWGGKQAGYFQGNVEITGKLGIGTPNPQNELHVVGLAKFELPTGSISVSTPGGWPGIISYSSNGHRRDIIVDDSALRLLTSPSSSPAPADNGITIREDGNVGIGTNFPGGYKLAVNGSAAKPGGGSWSNFSDIRLKEINGDYKAGLSEVSKLNPVRYRYKENGQLRLPVDKEFVGVIAQKVQSTIPEAVEQDDNGYLMVNNDPIIWAMVNAIKQLKSENESLKERLEALERTVQQHRFVIAKEVK